MALPNEAKARQSRLMTVDELAERLNCSRRTARNMAERGDAPPPISLGPKLLRWDREVVERWISDGCPRVESKHAVAESVA